MVFSLVSKSLLFILPPILSVNILRTVLLGSICLIPSVSIAREFNIGSDHTYKSPIDFPWEGILPGDLINIHWRATPYCGQWVINQIGTPEEPIIIRGIPGPKGERPVIEGHQALTRPQLDYWGHERAIIKIGGARHPSLSHAAYVLLEGLEIRGAKPTSVFIGPQGVQNYEKHAASIFIEKGDHITIRNCALKDSGNGLFVAYESTNILIESCHISGNGNPGSIYEHNVYSSGRGLTFQYNYLGPLGKSCPGNNLKDRSAGLVVRYNWIEAGNRQLDLVDGEDSEDIRKDPRYPNTLVYGNLLHETEGAGNNQIVHYGGDSGNEEGYRKGTLYFYNNTVLSERTDKTTLFRLSTPDEEVIAQNNIIMTTHEDRLLSLVDEAGVLHFTHNWIKPNYKITRDPEPKVLVDEAGQITGTDPGFVDMKKLLFFLKTDSPCLGKSSPLPTELGKGHQPTFSFHKDLGIIPRTRTTLSLGAFDEQPDAKP